MLGQHGQKSVEDRKDNTSGASRIKDRTAADASYMHPKIQIRWLARGIVPAFHVVMARYGGGAALAAFILQLLFFHVKARRANKFEDEEQRHDWLERHNAQRQRWELAASASALLVWNIIRQGRLRSSKVRGLQPFRESRTHQERLQEKLQGVRAWLAHLIRPHLALMVTFVIDVQARAGSTYRDRAPTAPPARRSSENSEAPWIQSEVQEHRVGYVHAGVQTERVDYAPNALTEPTDEPATAEQAADIEETESYRWPGQVLENRTSFMARFRAFTSQEKRQRERLISKDIRDTLTAQEMRDWENLQLLDYEADYSTLRIPQVGEFHGFDGILSRSATNEAVWHHLTPAFWTFTQGRPTCVFFDGCSGTGKSYTMLRGPNAIAGHFARAIDTFLQAERPFDVTTATLQHGRGRCPGRFVQGPSAKGASLQEAQGKIETAWPRRDGTDGKTANDLESSRSHRIIDLSVDVMIGGKRFQSSLGLVELAGSEEKTRGHDDLGATETSTEWTVEEEAEAEQEAEERSCIHHSRSALQTSLVDPSNLTAINSSEFTRHLKKYLYVEDTIQVAPEPKSQTPSVHKSPPTRKQRVLLEPKVFLVSCLSPFKSKLRNTEATLNFTTELRLKEASGRGAKRG